MKFLCRGLIALLASVALSSCVLDKKSSQWVAASQPNTPSIQDVNLTGTWKMTKAEDVYKDSTGEYLYTTYTEQTYVLADTADGVKYERCFEVGGRAPYGVKTATRFYMNVNDNGFTLVNPDQLVQYSQYTQDSNPGFTYKATTTLERISSDAVTDNGQLVLSGANANVNETNTVCYFYVYKNLGTDRHLEVIVPYDDETLAMTMDYSGDLKVGSYSYVQYNNNNQIYSFGVDSNSTAFETAVNSNTLAPSQASITITHTANSLLEGSFSFIGQDAENYTGSFSIQLP